MRNETKFKLQMMALVGSVAALAGCNTTQSANTASEGRLSWTKELEQQVESVPQVAAVAPGHSHSQPFPKYGLASGRASESIQPDCRGRAEIG